MTAKRVSRRPDPATPNTATSTQTLTEEAVAEVLESVGTVLAGAAIDNAELRRQMVATAAYFIAERRGFATGHELEDWVAAEAAVDSRLHPMRAA
jgi:DUF2934 family protein